jgi:hypothetical protein
LYVDFLDTSVRLDYIVYYCVEEGYDRRG